MIPSASAAKTSGVSSVSFTSGICFGWCGACCKTNLECKGGNKLWWWELAFSAWFTFFSAIPKNVQNRVSGQRFFGRLCRGLPSPSLEHIYQGSLHCLPGLGSGSRRQLSSLQHYDWLQPTNQNITLTSWSAIIRVYGTVRHTLYLDGIGSASSDITIQDCNTIASIGYLIWFLLLRRGSGGGIDGSEPTFHFKLSNRCRNRSLFAFALPLVTS